MSPDYPRSGDAPGPPPYPSDPGRPPFRPGDAPVWPSYSVPPQPAAPPSYVPSYPQPAATGPVVIAQFDGPCARCGGRVFAGTQITPFGDRWAHAQCAVQIRLPAPQVGYAVAAPRRDGLGTAGFWLAVTGFVIPVVGNLMSVVAIVLSAVALSRSAPGQVGRGLATAGLVIGILGVLVFFW